MPSIVDGNLGVKSEGGYHEVQRRARSTVEGYRQYSGGLSAVEYNSMMNFILEREGGAMLSTPCLDCIERTAMSKKEACGIY